ncbi:MAG: hypothetical protein FWB78_11945, partial [Treponema sp.]|nr:hypothetical protein [Treponema sp.]
MTAESTASNLQWALRSSRRVTVNLPARGPSSGITVPTMLYLTQEQTMGALPKSEPNRRFTYADYKSWELKP